MAYSPASANTVVAPFDGTFTSLYATSYKPATMAQLFKKYGKGFDVLDWLTLAGQEVPLNRRSLTSFSEGARQRPVKILSEIRSITNGVIAFGLAATEFDTNSDCYLRVGDTLMVPGYHFGKTYDVQFIVTTAPTSGNTDGAATAFEDLDSFTQNIAANQYIQVGPTAHAPGTAQPSTKSRGFYSYTFYTQISKETVQFAGGVPAEQLYFEVPDRKGGKGVYGMALFDGEFSLDSQISTSLFNGNLNDNSLTETDVNSASQTRLATKGMWMWAEDYAQDVEYVDSFTVKDLDAIDDKFKATGVICQSALLGVGHKLYKQIQDAAHDYIMQYSGGSVLTNAMGELGFTAKAWERSGIVYKLVNFAQLSNQQTYGANAQNFWTYAGLVIPDVEVTISDQNGGIYNSMGQGGKVTLPNVAVGYLQNNGEDRKRIIQQVSGVNGMGHIATNHYDVIQVDMLSEYMLIANQTEQWVRLIKDGTY
jgi:hypothetical protein